MYNHPPQWKLKFNGEETTSVDSLFGVDSKTYANWGTTTLNDLFREVYADQIIETLLTRGPLWGLTNEE